MACHRRSRTPNPAHASLPSVAALEVIALAGVFCKYSCPLSGYESLQNRPPESGTPCVLHSDCEPVQIVMLNYIIYRFFVLYLPKVASVLDTSISPNRFEHGYSNPETNPESASFSWVSVFARYVIHRWFGPISHVLPFVF